MRTIATLGPELRFLVVQFHIKDKNVPTVVPAFSDFHKSLSDQVSADSGRSVLEPTPKVMLDLFKSTDYQLIDSWHEMDGDNWIYRKVRYVFCRPDYVYTDKLNPDFLARRKELLNSLNDLVSKNLWQTMGHINPFFVNQQATDQQVLMLDCNSPKRPETEVFRDGRDELKRGLGPKVPLSTLAPRLDLQENGVVLLLPGPATVTAGRYFLQDL